MAAIIFPTTLAFFPQCFYIYAMGTFRNAATSVIFAKLANPLICFAVILGILYVGQHVLIPFSFSCLLAILLTSPSRKLENLGLSRGFSGMICLVFALIAFVVTFYFISTSVVSFKNDFPAMVKNIQQAITDFELWLQQRFNLSTEKVKEMMDSSASDVLPNTSVLVNTAITTVSDAFLIGTIVFLQTFLLLLYRNLIMQFFVSLFADEFSPRIFTIVSRTRYVIRSYIVGLFIEMVVVAVAYCGALFVLGVKYALLLGVIGAILNLVPYLGIFVACILTALITFSTNTPSTVIWSVASIVVIHLIDANVLLPKIVGSKVKINALATIMGVIIGGAIWGIPGMFLAVPAMAILKVVFEGIPALYPFAIIMDDDGEITPTRKPHFKKLVKKTKAAKEKVSV
ncbi:MAG TPA: AI-2E family transporter [Flavisolibacter sp.]|nr:AI-2E family transporter [Flavisolibacter sp.]